MSEERKLVVILEEDIELALQLKKYIREVNRKTDIFITGNVLEAYKVMRTKAAALLIADLERKDQNRKENPVIRLILQLRKYEMYLFMPIIVLDFSDNYRLYAFRDWHCVGHFVKPVLEDKFKELVHRMLTAIVADEQENFFVVRRHNVRYFVEVKDLMYVQYFNRALHLYMNSGDVLKVDQKPLRMVLEEAKARAIMQCNRNTLVNLRHVEQMDFEEMTITLKSGTVFRIGSTFEKRICDAWLTIDEQIKENEEKWKLSYNNIM